VDPILYEKIRQRREEVVRKRRRNKGERRYRALAHAARVWREPMPCDGCRFFNACAGLAQACRDFTFYTETGRVRDWHREPSAEIFRGMSHES
jgi:hypothetical protein